MARTGNGQPPATLRRARMLNALRTREFIRVNELGEMFGVSDVTIRADLDALAERGEVRRVHGGAMLQERSFEETSGANAEEKQAIGEAAAALVENDTLVALDVGTTAMAVAMALGARPELERVTVLTNALNIALELEHARHVSVVVTGGTLRPLQHSLVQPLADRVTAGLNPELAIVGCNGIDPERGVTNVNLPEAEIKRLMLASARRRVIVADGSKLGAVAPAHVWDVADVDVVITGASAPAEVVQGLRALGPQVVVT
jgi:DeoR family transcriptional regulator of aga operon